MVCARGYRIFRVIIYNEYKSYKLLILEQAMHRKLAALALEPGGLGGGGAIAPLV